jgi:hypothetical protein
MPEDDDAREQAKELADIVFRRKREARKAGMSVVEARLFAESAIDISALRHLVELDCPPELIARVLL